MKKTSFTQNFNQPSAMKIVTCLGWPPRSCFSSRVELYTVTSPVRFNVMRSAAAHVLNVPPRVHSIPLISLFFLTVLTNWSCSLLKRICMQFHKTNIHEYAQIVKIHHVCKRVSCTPPPPKSPVQIISGSIGDWGVCEKKFTFSK